MTQAGTRRRRGSVLWLGGAIAAGALIVACATTWAPVEPKRFHRTAPVAGADERVGAEECSACHDEVQGRAPIAAYHGECESCHGAGSRHVESEEPADIRFPASGDCLACHESGHTTQLSWGTGNHERAGVICSDCHNPHRREPFGIRAGAQVPFAFADAGTQLCASCHADVASRLNLPSHHPIREGMLGCGDCHDAHADRRSALGAPTALCAGCHQDHVGPWVFEHAPVAEDCGICHDPHGAASYNLLETSQPSLCLSCHASPDTWHLRSGEGIASGAPISPAAAGVFYTRCTDCHGAIHGSYEDPHLRR